MKKTLQKTLAVVMVIAMIFSQVAIISFAAEPEIVSITAVAQNSLIEGYDGYWETEWDYENECEVEYFRYSPNRANLIFTVTYKDGTVFTGDENEILEATGYWPDTYYSQTYDNQWGVGKHDCKIGILDIEGTVEIEVIENPVESIKVGVNGQLIENYNGYVDYEDNYWDEELEEWVGYNEFFYYYISDAEIDFTIYYKDGSVYNGNPDVIYNETGYQVSLESDQSYENQWGVGTHEFSYDFIGNTGKGTVEIVENPVESIEVTPTKDLIEKSGGYYYCDMYWDDELQDWAETEEYFYYNEFYDSDFFEYQIFYKDGSIYTGFSYQIEQATGFCPNVIRDNQSYKNQWDIGEHDVVINYLGNEITVSVSVVENPIKSITAVAQNDLIELTDGYWATDWDDENECETEEYFIYDLDYADFIYTVTYKDGTVITGDRWKIEEETGYDVEKDDNQNFNNQWNVGEHEVTVEILGVEGTCTINIIESPIDYIIVNDITLIENTDGDWAYDEYWDEDLGEWVRENEYFRYLIYPSYTAVMKDGTEYESDTDGSIFYNDRWIYMSYNTNQSFENQWGIGTYEVTGVLMGENVKFNATIVDTTIESMTLTPVRDLIIGIDDVNYQEYLDFVAEIKFKDGSTKECLVSELQYEYDSWIFSGEDYYVEENVRGGKFEFLGYEGEYTVKFVENPYESISISGTNELEITFNKLDGTTETATILDIYGRMGGLGLVYGEVYTDIGTFPGGISYAFDEATEKEYLNKDIAISIGDMESNTLETNNWYWAFSTSKDLYGNIQYYHDMNEEFAGIDITTGDYDINDVVNISVFDKAWKYDCEYDDYYLVFDADDVQEMVENTFNISNFDVTMYEGYNSANHTIRIEQWGGYGDWAKIDYTLEYKNGKWYGTREYSTYYSDEPEYINIILNDEMLLEKISFGKEDENIDTSLNGWINENGKWAYYENGIKVTNQWKADSKGWCYLDEDGYMLTNALAKDSNGWCYVGSNGYIVYNQWVKYDGKWYFIDANGYTVSNQWKKDSTGWCYLGSDGAMLTNEWVKDSKGWCYVSSNGYIVYNQWVNYGGKWYFVDANGYRVSNQWRKDSIGWCYLGSDGAMLTNEWVKDSKGYCYVGSNGYIVYNKWVSYDGKWYFVDANGYKVSSQWRKDSIGWCYLGSDGAMLTNKWVKDSKGWCYVDESGYIVYNQWINDGGKSYYIDANGYMVSNKWLKDGDNWRYVGADGSCLTNQWMKDSIGWCFLDENGYMVTNAMVTDSHGVCFVGEDGYWQSNVIIDDGYGYLYFDETGYMATDIIVYDGYGYRYFDETGYMVTDTWLTIDGESVYVDSNGYLDIQ